MARQRTRQPEAPQGFVASAITLPTATVAEAGRPQSWQTQAWAHFNEVGELRYLANWIGNVMSRATLHAARRVGNSLVPVTEGPAREAMDALYGGPQNQAQMIQLLGCDMTVGGEGYIVARGDDQWDVLATGKVTQTGTGDRKQLFGNFGGSQERVELRPSRGDLVMRVWTPHPTDSSQADAPTRSNLRTLSQIVGYDDHITAQLTSRLAGAGILFLPSEINFAAAQESDPSASQADQFLKVLGETMMAPIADRKSPAAFVPIVVTAPGEELDKVQHLTFWNELDNAVIEMREAAIRRFAIGMDVPPETLMGNSEQNHWNAWLSEESAIKAHLEPRLGVICAALTNFYLRAAITGEAGISDPTEYYVMADTSEIRTRPNRSTDALELHDRGLLNDEALMRETGFKPEDKATDEQYVRWLLTRIAQGAVTPELTAEALNQLGAKINVQAVAVDEGLQETPDHIKLDTGINDDGQLGGIPKREDSTSLQAACEVLVFRALERAGNRLKNKHPRTDVGAMPVHNIYTSLQGDETELLAGAWDCASEVLGSYTDDIEPVVELLDFYTRGLLSQKRPHNARTLSHLLSSGHLDAITTKPA